MEKTARNVSIPPRHKIVSVPSGKHVREYFGGFKTAVDSEEDYRQRLNKLQRDYPFREGGQHYRKVPIMIEKQILASQKSSSSGENTPAPSLKQKYVIADAFAQHLISQGIVIEAVQARANDTHATANYDFLFTTQSGHQRRHTGTIYLVPEGNSWKVDFFNIDGVEEHYVY